jgi:hypothetical protein
MFYPDLSKPAGNHIIDLRRVADIGAAPISLAEAKIQLRVTYTEDDTEISALILKAIRHVENYCNISIIYQRIQLIGTLVSQWALPYGPVIGIESVQDSTTAPGSGPVSYEASTEDWWFDGDTFDPVTYRRSKVVYTAGNFCPEDLKDVCLQVLTFLYDNRGRDVKVSELKSVLANADKHIVMLWV